MHTSLPEGAANLGKHLVARNRLHSTGTDIITATNRFSYPCALNLVGFGRIKTLNNALLEQSSGGGGKLHRLVGDLIECERHAQTITQ